MQQALGRQQQVICRFSHTNRSAAARQSFSRQARLQCSRKQSIFQHKSSAARARLPASAGTARFIKPCGPLAAAGDGGGGSGAGPPIHKSTGGDDDEQPQGAGDSAEAEGILAKVTSSHKSSASLGALGICTS